jgi:integrase
MTRRAGSVIRYEGKTGLSFRLRYQDADGVRVIETLGRAADGWTDAKAESALRDRLVDVKRERKRKLKPAGFKEFANGWHGTYPDAKGLKVSTRKGYRSILDLHLIPAFEYLLIEQIDVDRVESYVAEKRRNGVGPGTINRHLNLLNLIMLSGIKRGAVGLNPVGLVERPKEPRRRWTILTPVQIGNVAKAFETLARKAELKRGELLAGHEVDLRAAAALAEERRWLTQARVVFLVVVACGLRRGEVLGLRWRAVDLVDMQIRVEETFVWGRKETPKSEAGERTIAIEQVIAGELFDHRGRTAFDGDDELAFGNVEKGTVLDHKRYAKSLRAALKVAKIEKPMRPFHDGRHTAITNDAAAGNHPMAIKTRAGHSDFKTTQIYIDLAGETFRAEAERLGERLFGERSRSGKTPGKTGPDEPAETPDSAG